MEDVVNETGFGGAYRGRRVLVTGHTGFKGSWLSLWLRRLGADVSGLALAPDTTPSHWNLLGLADVTHHEADLRDAAAVAAVLADVRPEIVFHLAAQPLVRRGYREPAETVATNVGGLVNLFEAVRRTGSVRVLVNVTTDKVYRTTAMPEHGFREGDALGGHDPYSASKACAEILSESWRRSFFAATATRLATARAGNVIGGGDWADDRLVPDIVRAATAGHALVLRNPHAIRPWQHVLEPLAGYLQLGSRLLVDDSACGSWNFGPDLEAMMPVAALVERVRRRWPGIDIAFDTSAQPHETEVLKLDSRHAAEALDWRPVWSADEAIARTVDWYRGWHGHGELRSETDLQAFLAAARRKEQPWAS